MIDIFCFFSKLFIEQFLYDSLCLLFKLIYTYL